MMSLTEPAEGRTRRKEVHEKTTFRPVCNSRMSGREKTFIRVTELDPAVSWVEANSD